MFLFTFLLVPSFCSPRALCSNKARNHVLNMPWHSVLIKCLCNARTRIYTYLFQCFIYLLLLSEHHTTAPKALPQTALLPRPVLRPSIWGFRSAAREKLSAPATEREGGSARPTRRTNNTGLTSELFSELLNF